MKILCLQDNIMYVSPSFNMQPACLILHIYIMFVKFKSRSMKARHCLLERWFHEKKKYILNDYSFNHRNFCGL